MTAPPLPAFGPPPHLPLPALSLHASEDLCTSPLPPPLPLRVLGLLQLFVTLLDVLLLTVTLLGLLLLSLTLLGLLVLILTMLGRLLLLQAVGSLPIVRLTVPPLAVLPLGLTLAVALTEAVALAVAVVVRMLIADDRLLL